MSNYAKPQLKLVKNNEKKLKNNKINKEKEEKSKEIKKEYLDKAIEIMKNSDGFILTFKNNNQNGYRVGQIICHLKSSEALDMAKQGIEAVLSEVLK